MVLARLVQEFKEVSGTARMQNHEGMRHTRDLISGDGRRWDNVPLLAASKTKCLAQLGPGARELL